jgi:uncharacterized protein
MTDQATPYAQVLVHVHPRSHHTKLAFVGDMLHAWVAAPPVEGAANAAVIALLAQVAGVPRRQVRLIHGTTTRYKQFQITGLTLDDLRYMLNTP